MGMERTIFVDTWKGRDRPVHILLYALIPTDRACVPIHRGPFVYVRNRARRFADLMSWLLLRRWRAHHSTFKDATNTNRGDIAIRMGVMQQLRAAFAGREVRFTEVAWGELSAALADTQAIDLIVLAGGGFLFADSDNRLPVRFTADIKALSLASCPISATSIGLNYLIDPRTRHGFAFHKDEHENLRLFLSLLSTASVRDRNTQEALADTLSPPLPIVVDPGFLLTTGPMAPRKNASVLSIGLNVAFHGAHTAETSHRVVPVLARTLKRLQQKTPCRFHYFVHSDAERGIAMALRLSGLSLEIVHGDVAAMLKAYRQMDIHICQMLHSAILAMNAGTPTLSLAYDIKSAGFFELFGLSDLCLDMTKVNEHDLLAAITALIANRGTVANAIVERRGPLAKASQDFYAGLAALVPGHASPMKS